LAVAFAILVLPRVFETIGLGVDTSRLPTRAQTLAIGEGRWIHYVEHGAQERGDPIVLVHGLPASHSDWAELPEKLASRAHRRVIAYDRVGYGYSSRADPEATDSYTHASNAEDLLALLDGLEIRKAVLVGWSYGGGVVQTFAAAHPRRVSRAVFVGSTGPELDDEGSPSGIEEMMRSDWGHAVIRWAARIRPLARAAARAELINAFSSEDAIPEGWSDYIVAMITQPGTLVAFAREMERSDPSALEPEKIRVPTLVLHGTDDRRVSYAVAEDLDRRLPRSKLVPFFEGCHMLPATRPARVADEIARFLGV
jgi:pimeloyl-ACP methyl ester carboxylesterase